MTFDFESALLMDCFPCFNGINGSHKGRGPVPNRYNYGLTQVCICVVMNCPNRTPIDYFHIGEKDNYGYYNEASVCIHVM